MIRRTIVLPTKDNDGRSLRAEIDAIKADLLKIAGGFTTYQTAGEWIGADGRTYRDRSLTVSAVLEESADRQVVNLLGVWCSQLRQQALYTDSADIAVSFVGPA